MSESNGAASICLELVNGTLATDVLINLSVGARQEDMTSEFQRHVRKYNHTYNPLLSFSLSPLSLSLSLSLSHPPPPPPSLWHVFPTAPDMASDLIGVTDFIFASGTEPFGSGSFMCFDVVIIDDNLIEGEERFVVCACSSQAGVVILDDGCTDVIVEDNDRGKMFLLATSSQLVNPLYYSAFASFDIPLIR